MLQHDGGALVDASIVIDGSGDRQFKRAMRSYLRQHLDERSVRKVRLKDSRKDPLIQLADMVAGAIARSYRVDAVTAIDGAHDCSRREKLRTFGSSSELRPGP